MSSTYDCIDHAPGSYFVAIREDYVGICKELGMKNPACSAALLNLFERWSNMKYGEFAQERIKHAQAKKNKQKYRVNVRMWIYMPRSQIKEELQGLFGETLISRSLKELEAAKLIRSRNNPDKKWDRTLQYLFFPRRIQKLLWAWASSTNAPSRISTECKSHNYGMQVVKPRNRSRRNNEAIPQSPSQNQEQKPAEKEAAAGDFNIHRLFEKAFGQTLSPMMAERLTSLASEFDADWITAAFQEAIDNGARNLKYVIAILDRWKVEGKGTHKQQQAKQAKPKGVILQLPETMTPDDWEEYNRQMREAQS